MSVYHPIGTIVKLTIDEDLLFMISGYLTRQGDGNTYDYIAVPFPLGLMKSDQYISFNHDRITKVVHTGYCDEECNKLLSSLDQVVEGFKKTAMEQIDN